ncbi:hypothetical protein ACJX0J_013798, partial [Zea mays]
HGLEVFMHKIAMPLFLVYLLLFYSVLILMVLSFFLKNVALYNSHIFPSVMLYLPSILATMQLPLLFYNFIAIFYFICSIFGHVIYISRWFIQLDSFIFVYVFNYYDTLIYGLALDYMKEQIATWL